MNAKPTTLMKSHILKLMIAAALVANGLYAGTAPPAVPDSGGVAGMLGLGLLVIVAIRRQIRK